MIKPLWALAGIALLGTAGVVGAVIVASPGGEEEVVQQVETATPTASPARSSMLTLSPSPAPATLNPAPSPADEWQVYTDAQLGFSYPHPRGLTLKESTFEEHATDKCPAVDARIASLVDADGRGKVGVVVAPNPCDLSLEQWIRTYPGWPCEPNASPTCDPVELTLAGEPAIRFSINVLGEPSADIYFRHSAHVFILGGNVYGSGEANTTPTLAEEDFQRIVAGFKFAE